jgi:antitoxin FitA
MARMIQIRNVPDELHRHLKARAAMAGTSLSDYLLNEVRLAAERPTRDELRRRLERRSTAKVSPSPERAVRAERDSR